VTVKACVIGAGLGGLATAAVLARRGWQCDVYEREDRCGGRALSACLDAAYPDLLKKFEMTLIRTTPEPPLLYDSARGYTVDLGFHLIGGGKNGACVRFLRDLGIDIPFVGSRLGLIDGDVTFPIVSFVDKLMLVPRIAQLLSTRKSKIEAMKRMSVAELIERYGRGKMQLLLELFPRLITTVNDLTRISAGETLFAQRELMGGSPVVYPRGGMGRIAEGLAAGVAGAGGSVHLACNVDRILTDDDRVAGVSVDGDCRYYDTVVSTLPVQRLFAIADRGAFPQEWTDHVKNLQPTGSVVAYHAVSGIPDALRNACFVFIERSDDFEGGAVVGMVDFKMHDKTGLAPPGNCCIQSYAICTPAEARNPGLRHRLAEIIEEKIARLVPSFRKNQSWSTHAAIWHLDGVAKTIDCVKPDVATPVRGLLLAGDCVNSKGIGVNCAVDSARLVADRLTREPS
jgi:protoporphyrinogen oxidase